jgi:hypothetical protein
MTRTLARPSVLPNRPTVVCAPIRLRATITIDIEADDYVSAERAKAKVMAEYDMLRRACPGADLDFRQRKPRSQRRPPAPTLVLTPYVDD